MEEEMQIYIGLKVATLCGLPRELTGHAEAGTG